MTSPARARPSSSRATGATSTADVYNFILDESSGSSGRSGRSDSPRTTAADGQPTIAWNDSYLLGGRAERVDRERSVAPKPEVS
jgi:hypothetical protein